MKDARGRRPATTRRTAGRRASAQAIRNRTPEPQPRVVYTPRAIVLGIALVAVLMLVAVPARQWLAQRSEIARVQSERDAAQLRVDQLTAERRSFDDPKTVERLARERLHYVYPGEVGVLLTNPPTVKAAVPVKHGRAQVPKETATWYSRLWSSTVSASTVSASK